MRYQISKQIKNFFSKANWNFTRSWNVFFKKKICYHRIFRKTYIFFHILIASLRQKFLKVEEFERLKKPSSQKWYHRNFWAKLWYVSARTSIQYFRSLLGLSWSNQISFFMLLRQKTTNSISTTIFHHLGKLRKT